MSIIYVMNTGIVLGYGLFEESNQEYKDYLEWVNKQVVELGLDQVVLCGGFSSQQQPEISEAETMRQFLVKQRPDFNWILEEQSLTTPQNLKNSIQKIDTNDNIFVFGDLTRFAKIIWLSLAYILKLERSEIVDAFWEFGKDKKLKPFVYKNLAVLPFDFPSRTKYSAIAQSFSTLLEVESIYDPELDQKIIIKRKSDFGVN